MTIKFVKQILHWRVTLSVYSWLLCCKQIDSLLFPLTLHMRKNCWVLFLQQSERVIKPIGYILLTLCNAKCFCNTTQKKCPDRVWSVSDSRKYLDDLHAKIESTYWPIWYIQDQKQSKIYQAEGQRWLPKIHFEVVYHSGMYFHAANARTRTSIPKTNEMKQADVDISTSEAYRKRSYTVFCWKCISAIYKEKKNLDGLHRVNLTTYFLHIALSALTLVTTFWKLMTKHVWDTSSYASQYVFYVYMWHLWKIMQVSYCDFTRHLRRASKFLDGSDLMWLKHC